MDLLKYEERYTKLRERWDKDMKLSLLEQYVMKDSKGNQNKEAFASITPNLPKTYMDRSIAFMETARRRFDIRGVDTEYQKLLEEQRRDLIYPVNDELLAEQQIEPLEFCLNYFACQRGWVAGIALMQQDTKKADWYVPDIRPIDPRWLTWEVDARGMKRGAWRSRFQPDYIKDLWGFKDLPHKEDIDVYLEWDRQKFNIYIADYNGEKIISFSQKDHKGYEHKMDICPIVVEAVPTRPNIIGGVGTSISADLQHQGESLYAWNRELYEKLAELVSIWATLNKMQVLSPIVYVGNRKFTQMPFGLAAVIKLEKGEEILELPTKDMSATAERLFAQLLSWTQQGSLPNTEFGQGMDRESAMGWQSRSDTRNTIFVPRFNVKRTFIKKVNRLLRYQINNTCYKREMPSYMEDFAVAINKEVWAMKYIEDVVYNAISPEENIANYTLGKAARDLKLMPRVKIAREIMKSEDPESDITQVDREQLEDAMPELMAFRVACGLAKKDKTDDQLKAKEAEIINWRLDKILSGELPPIAANTPGQPSMPNLNANIAGGPGPQSGPERIVSERVRRKGIEAGRQGQNSNRTEAKA